MVPATPEWSQHLLWTPLHVSSMSHETLTDEIMSHDLISALISTIWYMHVS